MSFFNFTRQEQIAVLFLASALIAGGVVTLIKRHHPKFAPEFRLEERTEPSEPETVLAPEEGPRTAPAQDPPIEKVNINTAPIEDLMGLPGIGPKTAVAIATYRKEHGKFQKLEDLTKVKGIGKKTLERLNPFIKIE